MVRKTVGSRVFDVPERHVITSDFPFLPSSQNDGLTFVLNPDAERAKQILVGVDTAAEVCHRPGKPVVDMVPRACAVAEGRAATAPLGRLVKKLRFPDDDTQWDYHSENGGVVAMCTPESDNGSCDATFAWKNMIVSVSFDEGNIDRLEALQKDVSVLLQSWDRS